MYKNTKVTMAAAVAGILALAVVAFAVPHQAQAVLMGNNHPSIISHNQVAVAVGGNGGSGGAGGAGGEGGNGGTNNCGQAKCSANGGDANGGKGGSADGGNAIAFNINNAFNHQKKHPPM